jgi:predicted DNA repair protein MutK
MMITRVQALVIAAGLAVLGVAAARGDMLGLISSEAAADAAGVVQDHVAHGPALSSPVQSGLQGDGGRSSLTGS